MPRESKTVASDQASEVGSASKQPGPVWRRSFEYWLQTEIERDLTWHRKTIIALAAVCIMIALRFAAVAIIGSDLSFTVLFPVVLIATLIGGALCGAATVVAGSMVALAFSASNSMQEPVALPRLTVWLVSSSIAVAVAMRLRYSMIIVRRHEVELTRSNEQLQIIAGELEHRGRNALAIVDALSRDISRNTDSVTDYSAALSSRIGALSAGYSFITRRKREPVLLGSLVNEILSAFWTRIDLMDGPMAWLAPDACVAFALVVHELATNAVKHGALSVPNGRVAVSWRIVDNERLTFLWSEHNGPGWRPARRQRGFGSRMIEQAFNRIPGGSIAPDWTEHGLIWRLDLAYGPGGQCYAAHAERDGAGHAKLRPGADCG